MTILEDKEGVLDDAQHLLEHFADCHSGVVVFLIIGVGNFSKIDGNRLVSVTNQLKLMKTKQNSRFSSSPKVPHKEKSTHENFVSA